MSDDPGIDDAGRPQATPRDAKLEWEGLVATYGPYLRAVLKKRTGDKSGRRDWEIADLEQAAWIELMKRFGPDGPMTRDDTSLRQMIRWSVKDVVSDAARRDRGPKGRFLAGAVNGEAIDAQPADQTSVTGRVDRAIKAEAVASARALLTDFEREVIVLLVDEGLSLRKAAKRLGKTVHAVGEAMRAARARMDPVLAGVMTSPTDKPDGPQP